MCFLPQVGWYSEWAVCVMANGGTDPDEACDTKCPCDSSSCPAEICTDP